MTVLITPHGQLAVRSEDPFGKGFTKQNIWLGAGSVPLAGQGALNATYAGLYRTQPWLAAAVNKLSRGIARLPLKTYRITDADGNRERVRDHPIANMLSRPHSGMSSFRLKEWWTADLGLYGNSVTKIMRYPNGEPYELWPMPWPLVEVQGKREPDLYILHAPTGMIPIPAEDVLHLRYWSSVDSLNPLVGTSPVEPLRRTLMNEDSATRWSTAMFQRAGRPSGVVTTDKTLNQTQLDMVKAELEQQYGGVDNAFRIAVMQGGLKWDTVSFSAVEAGLLDLRRLNREEVAAAYDIPPPMIQILDHATFSNVDEQHRMLYMDTLAPWLVLEEEEFAAQIIASVTDYEGIFVEFDLGEVLKADLPTRAQAYNNLRRIYTLNELRKLENLPPIPGGDVIYVPINEAPLGAPNPLQQSNGQAAVLLNALNRAERWGASRLGAGRNGFDEARFARELTEDLDGDDHVAGWAASVARAVHDALAESETPQELKRRMEALRGSLTP